VYERFTDRAKQVLVLAQEEAERSQHSNIGTEHLLLGLLREGDGIAAKVLSNLDVEIDKVRQAIESMLARNQRIIVQQQSVPTSRLKKVIQIPSKRRDGWATTTSAASTSYLASLPRVRHRRPHS